VDVRRQFRILFSHVVGHVVHVPLEALAVESVLQSQLLGYVSHVQIAGKRFSGVEILLELVVEPNLDNALVVLKFYHNQFDSVF